MQLHRNSQKRFYGKDYTYFVTVVTQNRIPYFEEEIFCEVFYENLKMSIQVKGFMLHGWFLGYDHFHMLLALGDEFNISNIMQFLKRHVSRDVNFLMNEYHEGEIRESRLHNGTFKTLKPIIDVHDKKLKSLQKKFRQKYPHENNIPFPKFQWQRSFHDHVIRNQRDFETHLKYVQYNPLKHGMSNEWPSALFSTLSSDRREAAQARREVVGV